MRILALIACTLMFFACDDGGTNGNADTVADVTADVTSDATADVTADATPDATADATPDATADATPDATADATPDAVALTTYSDVQPIYAAKCTPCHTGGGSGGHNIGSALGTAHTDPATNPACMAMGLSKAECTIVRIKSGEMPLGKGCSGDPAQDAGKPACLTQTEQDAIQAWIDAGTPE